MIKSIAKFALLGLVAIAVTGTPIVLRAQDTNAAPATNKPPAKPSSHLPLRRSKVTAIDNTAMTITLGSRTFQITSQTIIIKDGKPATMSDVAVGDDVTGSVKKEKDGKWTALKLNFGMPLPKPKPASASNTKTNTP